MVCEKNEMRKDRVQRIREKEERKDFLTESDYRRNIKRVKNVLFQKQSEMTVMSRYQDQCTSAAQDLNSSGL